MVQSKPLPLAQHPRQKKLSKTALVNSVFEFKPSATDYADYCIVTKYSDKKGYKISKDLLEDLIKNSKNSKKKPLLIVSIRRSDKEMYVLKCTLEII